MGNKKNKEQLDKKEIKEGITKSKINLWSYHLQNEIMKESRKKKIFFRLEQQVNN